MAEQERPSRTYRRENISLLIDAIERRFKWTDGGQRHLAHAASTTENYISDVVTNKRGCGDRLAEKIEVAFRRPPGWLDHAHPSADLGELERCVPLLAGARSARKSPKRTQHDREIAELRAEIEKLKAERRSTPK